MPSDRTHPVINDHFQGLLAALNTGGFSFPVGEWQRPQDLSQKFDNPPYALLRMYPSAAQFEGPLSDSQVDIILRFQIVGVGLTQQQALVVSDICRAEMQPSKVTVLNRYIQSIELMVVSGGISRDDDLPIPFFDSIDVYEIKTTPGP